MKYKRSVSKFSVISIAIIDWLFNNTLGKLKYFSTYAPDIEILGNTQLLIRKILKEEAVSKNINKLKFLDIGARDAIKSTLAKEYEYHAIDIIPRSDEVILADICNCPDISDDTFDVVFSMDVLEHVDKPWEAAKECIRITKPGVLIIHRTLFAYRYHPSPVDY
jgi:SAM-dependent methyltransferase